jgi:hypothetical protein
LIERSKRRRPKATRSNLTRYCLAQTMTAFAPPSQLAPVVPSMRKGFPPAQ